MARTTGPLMSLSASGSIASTLTFAHWKGRPYVRQLVTPSNPRSTGQYFTRAMMAFLAQSWANLTGLEQAAWDALAKQGNFSAFNAYVRFNMNRWTQSLTPSIDPTVPGGGVSPVMAWNTTTGGVRQIVFNVTETTINDGFGMVIAIDETNAANPANSLTRMIVDLTQRTPAAPFDVQVGNLAPGTYSYSLISFTNEGSEQGAFKSAVGIVVT